MSNLSRSLADQLRDRYQTDGMPTGQLGEIFATEPVPLMTFLYDARYLGLAQQGIELSPIQYDYVFHFERIYNPDTYIALIEQLGDDWIPPRMCHTLTALWAKGSSAPYTPVYNADTGQWQRLDEFKSANVAAAHKEDGKIGKYVGTNSFKEGEGEMFRVTTASGLVEDVWEGHRYLKRANYRVNNSGKKHLTKNPPEWTRLWDLQIGDHIALAGTLPEPTNPITDIQDEVVELIGLFLGDGSCSKVGVQPQICGGKLATKTQQRVKDLYQHFGWSYRENIREDDEKWSIYAKNETPNRWNPNPFRTLLHKYGLDNKVAATKFIPSQFLSLDNRQTALFLSRLIDTDGSVCLSNTAEIKYSTTSEELAEGVRKLFLRLGVPARITTYQAHATNGNAYTTAYTIRVRNASQVKRLGEQLTLLDKADVLSSVLNYVSNVRKQSAPHGDLHWDKIVSIESIGWGEYWTLSVDGPACYVSSGGILSHNSGKDSCARMAFSRISDLLLNLHSPQAYFGLPTTDEIQMLNVAVSAPQAHRAFFRPLRNMLVRSPRFADQFRSGEVPSDNTKSILFKKNLELISGHSQADSMEGLNIIAGIADEIAAFKSETELQQLSTGRQSNQTADYIIDMLRSSASTRFPNNFKIGLISFPRYEDDAIMTAAKEGRKDNEKYGEKSTHYVSGPWATWDVNPRVSRNSPEIQRAYDDDPEYAAAKYECKPPKAVSRFLRSDTAIEQGFSREDTIPAIEIEYFWGLPPALPNDHLGEPQEGWQVKFYFSPELQPMEGAIYCLHGDLAIKQDSAGVAMAHVSQYRQAPHNHQTDFQPVVKVDFITSFDADLAAMYNDDPQPREVKIRWYRQLIFELLAKGFNIGHISCDQFQSFDLLQQMEELGINAEVFSLDRTMKGYSEFKNVLYDGRLDAPYDYITTEELKKLSYTGKKCDHLPGGSKDRADSVAGAVYWAVQEGGSEGNNPTAIEFKWENSPHADVGLAPELLNMQMIPEPGMTLGLDISDYSW